MENYLNRPLRVFLVTASMALCGTALANPVGENVTAGQVGFTRTGDLLTVTQNTQNAIVNWQNFSVGAGETTRFTQPSANAAILNRVVGGNLSEIYGSIEANGNVFLLNPNGVVVGPGGTINAAGFTASTFNISDADFLAGDNLAFSGNSTASIRNLGTINAGSGDITLIGQEIHNEGTLSAPNGTATLAAGSAVLMHPGGSNKVSILAGSAPGTLANSGLVEGANAALLANGGNAGALAINTTGIIRATGLQEENGRIILSGGEGNVLVNGTLDAKSAYNGGQVDITAKKIYVDENANVSANGTNGGSIKLFGTDSLESYGTLQATGTNHGGFIETSGGWLNLGLKAPNVSGGLLGGTWLIDPYNIEIVAGSGNTSINTSSPFTSSGNTAQLGVGLITTALASGNVTVQTGSGGGQAGDITLQTDLDYNGIGTARTLTLTAQRNVTLNGKIYDSSAGGESLGVTFNADSDNNGLGATIVNNDILTGGGNLTFNSAAYLAGASALTLNVGAGNMSFTKQVQLANTNGGITLTTGGGAITFSDALDSGNDYTFDATTRTWLSSLSAVKTGTGANTGDTYLATITSALENSIGQSVLPASTSAWLGGADTAVEGQWRWVAGPEGLEASGAGRQFWQGASGGSVIGGNYNNWNSGEPNDSGGAEDALQIGFGTAGEWNDYPTNSSLLGSVVETNLAPTNLTVNTGAGSVTFNGKVGADKQIGNLTINSGGTTNINNDVTSAGTVDLKGAYTWGAAGKTLTAGSLVTRAAGTTAAADTTFVADDMDIQSTFTSSNGSGVLGLRQRTNGTAVDLGAVGDATASTLELSAAEMGRLNVHNVRVGSGNAGNLTLTDNMTLTGLTNLTLATGGTLTDAAGKTLNVTGLALSALGSVTFDNAHDVDNLAIYSPNGNAKFYDADGFNIANVDGIVGAYAATRLMTLSAGGAVTQNQAITMAGLELLGAGADWTLTNTSNNIDTLAGNTKSVNYLDSNALAMGTVNSSVGLTTSGQTQARTLTGNLSVWSPVAAGGTGNSLILAAGGAFDNNQGAGALNPGAGRYLIYTSTRGATDLDSLTPAQQYNKTFSGNAPNTIGGTGNQVLYSYTPTLTFTADNFTRTYGALNLTYTVTGYETGDSAATAFSGAPTLTPASQNVGTRTVVPTVTGLTNLQGYTFAFANGSVVINPALLTITADNLSKEFAHENPTLTATYTGLVNGDTTSAITGLTLATDATKDSPQGTYAITATGGTNSNYTITRVDGTLTVNPFEQANNVKEELTTFSNVPTKLPSVDINIEPAAGPVAQTNTENKAETKTATTQEAPRTFITPQVGVQATPQTHGSGNTGAEGSGTGALAQTSTLDLIEEATQQEKAQ